MEDTQEKKTEGKKIERKYIVAAIAGVLVLCAGTTYAIWREGGVPARYDRILGPVATTTNVTPKPAAPEPPASESPFGGVALALGETRSFPGGLSLQPLAVLEDSRCPANARCFWAGTVRVSVRIISGLGESTATLEPGTTITTEAEAITLLGVSPERISTQSVPESQYRFSFKVATRPGFGTDEGSSDDDESGGSAQSGGCYVGGCSSQLCTDDPDAVSTCEWRAEYACYRNARCERQADGDCGWTETSELKACLASVPTEAAEEDIEE